MDCAVCATRPAEADAALGPDWFVSIPGGDAPIAGWVTLATRVHHETVGELSAAEAETLGALLSSISRAIVSVTGAERTYIANWAEGTRHVHFHIVPRLPGLDSSRLGAEVFRLMSDDVPHPPVAEQERVLDAIRGLVAADRS